jgi:CRISPR-associated protein Cmr4
MMEPIPYFLFTHTPLHVGAGQSVGYVDLPIQRELHTRIPIIPGSALKGVFRDRDEFDEATKARLFGHEFGESDSDKFKAGELLIGEARVLCFPVRSAKGCFAWITCPLALARYARDAGLKQYETRFEELTDTSKLPDNLVAVIAGTEVELDEKVVLEEYTYKKITDSALAKWEQHLVGLSDDPVWQLLPGRFVIVPDGIFSFYVVSACEIAQHVAIDDDTGTARDKALFNEETVPSETLFYGVVAEQKIEGRNGAVAELRKLLDNKPKGD